MIETCKRYWSFPPGWGTFCHLPDGHDGYCVILAAPWFAMIYPASIPDYIRAARASSPPQERDVPVTMSDPMNAQTMEGMSA